MSPRPYNLGLRKAAAEETRARIIEAARQLLAAPDGIAGFSLDAVARQAGVARMTVYYQFGTRLGLLEAIYDDLGTRGLLPDLPNALKEDDPRAAFLGVVRAFMHFWAFERVLMRRLRALALLDPEVEKGVRNRDALRRAHFTNALNRLTQGKRGRRRARDDNLLTAVYTLTSFETYDTLASETGSDAEAERTVLKLLEATLAHHGYKLTE
jgi:AcrR family transcriptional regulator